MYFMKNWGICIRDLDDFKRKIPDTKWFNQNRIFLMNSKFDASLGFKKREHILTSEYISSTRQKCVEHPLR